MKLKAKICGSLLLALLLWQMFDASLFPHTHFLNGRFIAPVTQGNEGGQPEPCHAQDALLALMSVTVVAAALVSVGVVQALCRTDIFAELRKPFLQNTESRDNCLRGPPAPATSV